MSVTVGTGRLRGWRARISSTTRRPRTISRPSTPTTPGAHTNTLVNTQLCRPIVYSSSPVLQVISFATSHVQVGFDSNRPILLKPLLIGKTELIVLISLCPSVSRPMVSSGAPSTRTEIMLTVDAFIAWPYKIVQGSQGGKGVWVGQQSPNATKVKDDDPGCDSEVGCLFNIELVRSIHTPSDHSSRLRWSIDLAY